MVITLRMPIEQNKINNHNAIAKIIEKKTEKIGKITKLPIPRFVSLKANEVNLRVGPGKMYPIKWKYKKKNIPVEVIQEFETWRKIRDVKGKEGWILHSLLSAKRTAIVTPWLKKQNNNNIFQNGHKKPNQYAQIKTKMQAGLMVNMIQCKNNWCLIEAQKNKSWMQQEKLWGTYPNEKFKK